MKMNIKPLSTIERAISLSKSKFSKFQKVNLPFFKKNLLNTEEVQDEWHRKCVCDCEEVQNDDIQPAEIPLTFEQNLKEQHFAVAGKQLVNREEHLFSVKQDGVGSSKSLVEEEEDSEESLRKDFEDLLEEVWSTVENSFEVQTENEKEALKQAVLVIQQEEEQDRRWEGVAEKERPPWRPRCCRWTHDSLLQNIVQRRMEEAKLDSNADIKSSIQKEIIGKGKQLKEDLLHIAEHVRSCYPGENVCQLYAKLYHQAFCAKLREITDYGLSDDDCSHVLQWVNIHYPSIMRRKELKEVIEYEQLKALLPENMLEPLEEQCLPEIEDKLQTWCQNILKEEKAEPELRDGCYFSPLATDVIECVHGAIKLAQEVLGSCSKPQRITHQIKEFFIYYQDYLKSMTEGNQGNTDAVLKANLLCIRQFREYMTMNQELFPAHIKSDCMNLLVSIRELCHGYFTKSVQKDLKGTYAKLGTSEWLKHSEHVCGELLEGVDTHIQKLTNLDETCFKDLLSHLHKEVLAEYVRTLMKKKIKLGDEKIQQQAAEALCDNNQRIHSLFIEAGSKMDDLEDVLPRLAEVLTLKAVHFIEFELMNLSKSYPDFSEAHVCAWLHLKATLSTSELRMIRKTFSELRELNTPKEIDNQELDPLYSSRDFFSKVLV
ncbi:tumor necrosis factor alpha-induced protein 2-like [Colossoma macropomum]|uniref:tumor necrosis factor alpha-induced protein 2-like n=1 Tax=Colossoma macropomum TaxID=42526 RepID=UPI0018643D49|nr:tumor necrosis factor alpha-induced protein 2-like [Colossoma macropomum]